MPDNNMADGDQVDDKWVPWVPISLITEITDS